MTMRMSVQQFKDRARRLVVTARTKEDLLSDIEATLKKGISLLRPVAQKLHTKYMITSTKPMFPTAAAKPSTQAAYVHILWEAQHTMYEEEFSKEWVHRGPQGRLVHRDRDEMLKEIKAAVSGFQKVDGDTPYVLGKKFPPVGPLLDRKDTEIRLLLEDKDSWMQVAVVTFLKTKDLVKLWEASAPQAIRELKVEVSKMARSGSLKG